MFAHAFDSDTVYFWKLLQSSSCPSITATDTIETSLVKVRVTCNCTSCAYGVTQWQNEFILRLKSNQSYMKELKLQELRRHIAQDERLLHLCLMYVCVRNINNVQ